jgi:1,4-dihydroxy-2-naphthoate octaprenyltransferase
MVGLTLLHIAVNVLNEVSDARTGIDYNTTPTPFSGGSKTIPSGALSWKEALIFGLVCAMLGLLIGIWFLLRIGTVLLPVMVLGAIMVLFYSNALVKIAIGELAAGLGLGGLAVFGSALVQDGSVSTAGIAAAIPATFMTFNLLLLNEFPDEEHDREGGRRHLVIVFGRPAAALIYAVAAILTPISIVTAVLLDYLPVIALAGTIPSLLLVQPLKWVFNDPATPVPIPALASNVQWNLGTNLLLALSLVFATVL